MRIWSSGCASGEEAYSVAMLIAELLESEKQTWTTHIFATDIDEAVLEVARAGIYGEDQLIETKLGIIRKYFRKREEYFEILPEIREMVLFSRDDLTSPILHAPSASIFGEFDLILCRNVLIYLNPRVQHTVCEKLSNSLKSGGYLILGEAEHLPENLTGRLTLLNEITRIYLNRS